MLVAYTELLSLFLSQSIYLSIGDSGEREKRGNVYIKREEMKKKNNMKEDKKEV